jgi:starch phosphorylase
MWAHLWPWRVEEEIPIGHITNGVHVPTGSRRQMQQLYDRNFPVNWIGRMGEPEVWQTSTTSTRRTLGNAPRAQEPAAGVRPPPREPAVPPPRRSDEAVEAARNMLDPNVLTIGFARRFATYKRADLIAFRVSIASSPMLLNDADRPVQIDLRRQGASGRRTRQGTDRSVANLRHDPRFAGRVAFVEDYDINVADTWCKASTSG